MHSEIDIFTTGGTIDKIYFDALSEFKIGEPIIEQILTQAQVAFSFTVTELLKKDSLDLTAEDRNLIKNAILNSSADKIIVTHGTDTMVLTGKELKTIPNKTIVLVGSLNPARFQASDAIFNIGCAVTAAQSMPPGVWLTMNGRIFPIDKVQKNRAQNRFESI